VVAGKRLYKQRTYLQMVIVVGNQAPVVLSFVLKISGKTTVVFSVCHVVFTGAEYVLELFEDEQHLGIHPS